VDRVVLRLELIARKDVPRKDPAYSFDRGVAAGVVLVHKPFAITGGGSDVTGQMLRMNTVVTRDGPDGDIKNQYFILSDGAGTVWLAHRYAYTRRGRGRCAPIAADLIVIHGGRGGKTADAHARIDDHGAYSLLRSLM
jgi:hypothetical protein